eukprot:Gregarina_sp_Poly_1__7121@NODE_38_length_18185_cov_164_455735_g33_i0_p16_GENE_NODE_38_length_18185_cov_164_455735_g33_i0NODE_38_length_18185_cov_164_455735_g33_i0_p16_ORF_typecomplete_len111_score10_57_NODE_38_length_18185_cov_164_455735_g33_i034083740
MPIQVEILAQRNQTQHQIPSVRLPRKCGRQQNKALSGTSRYAIQQFHRNAFDVKENRIATAVQDLRFPLEVWIKHQCKRHTWDLLCGSHRPNKRIKESVKASNQEALDLL